MTDITPQIFKWDAERSVMVPLRPKAADRIYVDEETYRLGVIEERSWNSHNHYFASIHEAFINLPESEVERFPSEDHLRKWALVQAGYCNENMIVCDSNAEAIRAAQVMRGLDGYAVIVVSKKVVRVLQAKSQSMRAMGKKEFQESKDAVLGIISELIGTSAAELKQNSGKAA